MRNFSRFCGLYRQHLADSGWWLSILLTKIGLHNSLGTLNRICFKTEVSVTGDICRTLYTSNVVMNGESSVFHAINRNKESFTADLKNEDDCQAIRQLLEKADVVLHNYRPGVMERLGFDYKSVSVINPGVVYGEISGYGTEGE